MLFNIESIAIQLLASSALVSAVPLERRAVIGHDKVVGFPQTVPSGLVGELYLKYQPYLKVFNGCVPFPAVDSNGDTGGGLKPTGDQSSGCSKSPGQVYARSGIHNGAYGIMYSWYMPKDSPSSGTGHRHDWENVVLWLSSESSSATVRGIAISAHGDYQKEKNPPFDGDRPKIGYQSTWPLNHQLVSTSNKGGEQPLVAWESMTKSARQAIENTDFGKATPKFRDNNFEDELKKAYF